MIKIDKYTIKKRDNHNPFTIYEDYESTNKDTQEVTTQQKEVAYLSTLPRALMVVFERLQADSELTDPDVLITLSATIELIGAQMEQFLTIIESK